MYTTLDHLEKYTKNKNSIRKPRNMFKEIKILWLIFWISLIFILVFTNAQLFFWNILESFSDKKQLIDRNKDNINEDNSISSFIKHREEAVESVQELIRKYKNQEAFTKSITSSSKSVLKNKLKSYDFKFNTLPPTDRIIISSISVDVPLVSTNYKEMEDFTKWNFDEELKQWIVKYPTTINPWEVWNSLLFGHTSTEFRDGNKKYGTVLKHLPDLKIWETIKIIWKWVLYEYQVVEEEIVYPSKVNKVFTKFQERWEKYVSIMWCYPIGKSDKRMIKIAKLIE